jgi:hypothetical protein
LANGVLDMVFDGKVEAKNIGSLSLVVGKIAAAFY